MKIAITSKKGGVTKSTQTKEIALQTDSIAKEIVNDVIKKEFIGKNEVSNKTSKKENKQIEQAAPAKEELEVCAYIQNVIERSGGDISWLRYRKNSSNYVDATCLYTFLRFKFAKKGKYIIVRNSAINGVNLPTEACTVSEGGTTYARVYFNSPFDLDPLSNYIFSIYSDCYKSMKEYISMSNYTKREAEQNIRKLIAISRADMETLLFDAGNREYDNATVAVQVEAVISREDVVINAVHNCVPLSEIRNFGNWKKGFDAGYPYWERGEAARKVHSSARVLL